MKDILCDVDGTIADGTHRQHFLRSKPKNWKAFNAAMHLDPPHLDILWLTETLHKAGNRIIIVSAREGTPAIRKVTEEWLNIHMPYYHALYMREAEDYDDDGIVKIELLAQIRADGYDPFFVLDDRNRVVKAWRQAGLRCLQVQEGDF